MNELVNPLESDIRQEQEDLPEFLQRVQKKEDKEEVPFDVTDEQASD